MAAMGFLIVLPSEYDSAKAQILFSPKISPLQDTFSKILCTKISSSISSPTHLFAHMSSARVGQNISELGKQ